MKKITLIILSTIVFLTLTGCKKETQDSILIDINYSQLEQAINNKETFILVVVQDGCGNCTSFKPKLETVLKNNNLTAKSLNLTYIESKDYEKYTQTVDNVSGTPTVLFYKDGKEISKLYRLVGDQDKNKIIEKLETAGYKIENK